MPKLQKLITPKVMLVLTINAVMGTGILFLPAIGVRISHASSLLAWVIVSVMAVITSTYFSELVSAFPKAGGVYEFSRQAFGGFFSFLVGWVALIVCDITIAMLIIGGIYYLLPEATALTKIIISLFIILVFSYVTLKGVKSSVRVLLFFSALTLGLLAFLAFSGLLVGDYSKLSAVTQVSLVNFLVTMFLISENFFGWETTTFLAEETSDVSKLPRIIVLATAIMAVITLVIVVATIINSSPEIFYSNAPLAVLAEDAFGSTGFLVSRVWAFLVIMGSVAGWIVAAPRLILAMSRDNAFIYGFEELHEKYSTPFKAIYLQAVLSSIIVIAGLGTYEILLELLLPLVLFVYSAVIIAALKLRNRKDYKPTYKSPFGSVGAYLVIVFNLVLFLSWLAFTEEALSAVTIGSVFILLGFPVYLLVRLQDKRFVEKFFDFFSWLDDLTMSFWVSDQDILLMLKNAEIKKGDVVLDYGCGTGKRIKKVSRRVGNGKVVALDVSIKQLDKSVKRAKKEKLGNVIFLKEGYERVKFPKNTFDAIISVSVLSYQKDPLELLREFRKMLKKDGRLSLIEFGKILIFNQPWFLRNKETVEELFKIAGFSKVKVIEKRKHLSTYYFIKAVP